ncbi:unnamed protein product, partial [Rhizoctonia solani]
MLGHPRDPSIPLFYVPNATGRSFLRLISPIFFRRISPVETKSYAFVRNLFAASAVGVIVFRTTTALLQAQNKVDTRMKTRDCSDTEYRSMPHNIQVLTEYDSEVANTAVYSQYILNGFLEPCKSVLPQIPGNTWIQQIFSCDIPASQVPVFRIEIRSPAGSALSEASMPHIWLPNKNEEENSAPFEQYNKRAVRAYSPVWRLRPGFHVEAEARLITRRFISSSVLRDIVLNSDSKYIQRSLYPIVETSRSPLLDSTGAINASQATSTIHTTLGPGFENYYRSQQDFWNMQRGLNNFAQMCDYIEDYRSGSVLDVLGSEGFPQLERMDGELNLSWTHLNVEPGPAGLLLLQLALWPILIINDSFMLTIDFRRNGSYLGCIATQAIISFISIVLTCTALGLYIGPFDREPIIYGGSPRHGKGPLIFGIPIAISVGSSLSSLAITISPVFMLQSRLSREWLWKCNTKDAFTNTIVQLQRRHELRMFGHPRDPPMPLLCVPHSTAHSFLRLISPLFFRRISPVETKGYAFIRNLFAASAVGVIIFRTATALSQAQNKIDTRMKTKDCNDAGYEPKTHNIQVLTEYDSTAANITIFSEIFNGVLEPCHPVLSQTPRNIWIEQIFSCNIPSSQNRVFRFEIYSPAGSALIEADMPRIWLSNKEEEKDAPFDQYNKRAARVYTPVWKLRPGFHVETEARLITRRFISSSIFRDIVLNSDSKYTQRSLYPIVETGRSPLVDSTGAINTSQATSTIRATLSPGFENYYRSQEAFWNMHKGLDNSAQMCDYIEDYRSGSVLDILGSVGGLFALLQTAHVLLFGRPLLWGLT